MARRNQKRKFLTREEWDDFPIAFDVNDAARAYAASVRWVNDHAPELGAKKIAGRWVFSKSKVAAILGIGE